MIAALIVLLILLALFGGLGFAIHWLWWILIAVVVLWALGFLFRGGSGRWYYW